MPKAAVFTMKLNPDLRAEFMTAINNGGRRQDRLAIWGISRHVNPMSRCGWIDCSAMPRRVGRFPLARP
jgi:hypothetical protein